MSLLEVDNLTVRFTGRRLGDGLTAVDGVSLTVEEGEVLGLVGESGCGKSTLARAIVGLERAQAGSVRFAGQDLRAVKGREARRTRAELSFVFQDPLGSLSPRLSVGDAIEEPLVIHRRGDRAQRRRRVDELLGLVSLPTSWRDRRPSMLSGGERQRVAIARALALQPRLIICDEPVTALDVSIQAQVMDVFADLQERLGLAYLFIGHDLGVVRQIADRVAVMYLGQVVESGPVDEVFARPRHPYTHALVSAIPVPDPVVERSRERVLLTGDLPSPLNPPSGCRFRTRCPLAEERCAKEAPALADLDTGRASRCFFADRVPLLPVAPVVARREAAS